MFEAIGLAVIPAVTVVGLLLILGILTETFEVMLLPRRVPRRVRAVRVFFRLTWWVWSGLGVLRPEGPRRQSYLAVYGPLSMVLLIITWALGLILGFSLLQWGLDTGSDPRPNLTSQLYTSGLTFFTVGFGDVSPRTSLAKLIAVAEAGTGFGFIAVVIGYLPVLYQLYARREIHVMQLDARAGSPPCALTLLCRHAQADAKDELAALLRSWEAWCSELLVSHLSYPMLSYYRSQRDNQSWLAGLAAVMDSCALIMVGIKDVRLLEARMTFAMARVTVLEMSRVFETKPAMNLDRLSRMDFEKLAACLSEAGLVWSNQEEAERRLASFRAIYEPLLQVLSNFYCCHYPVGCLIEGCRTIGSGTSKACWRHGSSRAPNSLAPLIPNHDCRASVSPRLQIAMDGGNGPCSLADGGSTSLDRAVPHIAGCEHSRKAGFHINRAPIENPVLRTFMIAQQIRSSEYIAPIVAEDPRFSSPLGLRYAAET